LNYIGILFIKTLLNIAFLGEKTTACFFIKKMK